MEKLKELLIIALIWAVIIWFARVMKRKSNEQSKKFQENIPEMELIDEEERSYICENMEPQMHFLVICVLHLFLEGLLILRIFCVRHGLKKEKEMKREF